MAFLEYMALNWLGEGRSFVSWADVWEYLMSLYVLFLPPPSGATTLMLNLSEGLVVCFNVIISAAGADERSIWCVRINFLPLRETGKWETQCYKLTIRAVGAFENVPTPPTRLSGVDFFRVVDGTEDAGFGSFDGPRDEGFFGDARCMLDFGFWLALMGADKLWKY